MMIKSTLTDSKSEEVPRRRENVKDKFVSTELGKVMHQCESRNCSLLLRCIANFVVRNETCWKLLVVKFLNMHEHRYTCTVSGYVPA